MACREASSVQDSQYYDFDSRGMIPNMEYIFYPFKDSLLTKSQQKFDIVVSLRYTDNCPLRDLPIDIEKASLDNDSIISQHCLIPLFDMEGKISGKGNYGIYEAKKVLFRDAIYEEGYYISISTPQQDTSGLLSIGVTLEKQI